MFNDDWVRDRGFLEDEKPNAISLAKNHENKKLITAGVNENLSDVLNKMTKYNISQLPVIENNEFVGSVNDSEVYSKLISDPALKDGTVKAIMGAPYDFVDGNASIEEIADKINKQNRAVMVKNRAGEAHIITIHDIIESMNPKKG
jgi:cystathionine beta-synthase